MPHDVFISYASEDAAPADAVRAALEGAGIRCWIARRDIMPGELAGGDRPRDRRVADDAPRLLRPQQQLRADQARGRPGRRPRHPDPARADRGTGAVRRHGLLPGHAPLARRPRAAVRAAPAAPRRDRSRRSSAARTPCGAGAAGPCRPRPGPGAGCPCRTPGRTTVPAPADRPHVRSCSRWCASRAWRSARGARTRSFTLGPVRRSSPPARAGAIGADGGAGDPARTTQPSTAPARNRSSSRRTAPAAATRAWRLRRRAALAVTRRGARHRIRSPAGTPPHRVPRPPHPARPTYATTRCPHRRHHDRRRHPSRRAGNQDHLPQARHRSGVRRPAPARAGRRRAPERRQLARRPPFLAD